MAFEYKYGVLEDQLIDLLRSGVPDFDRADELIQLGADLNAMGRRDDENILSEILRGYGKRVHLTDNDPEPGHFMCHIIGYFLYFGFDVNRMDGCFGAQCLAALAFSTFDRHMIAATKMFLDRGARNGPISPFSDETPWSIIAAEENDARTCHWDHALENIYEAVCQIYQAVEEGRSYRGIDSYEQAIGQKVLNVLAEEDEERSTFYPLDRPGFKSENCFGTPLYFRFEHETLVVTAEGKFWTTVLLPEIRVVDVSEHFPGVVGSVIQNISFDHREVRKGDACYGQPITILEMDSGQRVKFSINDGEVEEEERAAYFALEAK